MKFLNKLKRKSIYLLVLACFLLRIVFIVFRSKKLKGICENFQKFIDEQKREAKEFIEGEETLDEYCRDSSSIFKDYFIPYDCNDHKPKILRTKPLAILVVLLLLLKISVTGYLFFIYPNQAEMQNKIASDVLALVNEDRSKNGLTPLTRNPILSASASVKADDMLNKNYFAHYSPDGKTPWDWVNRSEYPYLLFGENLAMNFSSAKSAHRALMKSESHKKNILNDKYNEIGLAVTTGKINGKDTSILVQFFAKRQIVTTTPPPVTTGQEKVVVEKEIDEGSEKLVLDQGTEPTALGVEKIVPEKTEEEPTKEEDSKIEPAAEEDIVPEKIVGQIQEVDQATDNQLNTQIAYFQPETNNREGMAAKLVSTTRYIYLAVLAFVIIALALNIFIKLTIQHRLTIIQTVFVIILIIGLLSIRLHMLENIVDKVAVL